MAVLEQIHARWNRGALRSANVPINLLKMVPKSGFWAMLLVSPLIIAAGYGLYA